MALGWLPCKLRIFYIPTLHLFVCLQDRLLLLEEEEEEVIVPSVPTDGMFIWRIIMLILASLSAITGTAVVALDFATHQVKFRPTNSKKM